MLRSERCCDVMHFDLISVKTSRGSIYNFYWRLWWIFSRWTKENDWNVWHWVSTLHWEHSNIGDIKQAMNLLWAQSNLKQYFYILHSQTHSQRYNKSGFCFGSLPTIMFLDNLWLSFSLSLYTWLDIWKLDSRRTCVICLRVPYCQALDQVPSPTT